MTDLYWIIPLAIWFLFLLLVVPYRLTGKYYRQRNVPETKPELYIEVGEVNISSNGIVKANIRLRPTKKMKLTKILLNCGGKPVDGIIQSNTQLPHFIKKGANYSVEFNCFDDPRYAEAWIKEDQLLLSYGQKRRGAGLTVYTDEKPWPSPIFFVPTTIGKPPFILKYEMVKKGELTLEKQPNGYRMALSISIRFKNRDKLRSIWVNKYARVSFDAFLDDGTMEPQKMQNMTGGDITLRPDEEKVVDYKLEGQSGFDPKLLDTICCHWEEMGHVSTMIGHNLQLELLEPFDVKINRIT